MSTTFERILEGVRIGRIRVFALQDSEALARRKQKFLAQMETISETEHFLIGTPRSSQHIFVFHTFRQDTIDADLICFIEHELCHPLNITSTREHGAILFAVLASTFPSPRNQALIWRRFCINTLEHFHILLSSASSEVKVTSQISQIGPFSIIYKRVFELIQGHRLLDVGSSFGFLPLLIPHYCPEIQVMGCDKNAGILAIATDVATIMNTPTVSFTLRDVLAEEFAELGTYETVTALHLLEHLNEQELPRALTALLHVTSRRLIIAVPYEQKAQDVYGHHQTFTRQKLLEWGEWCSKIVGGVRRYEYEEVMGGMLIIDRE